MELCTTRAISNIPNHHNHHNCRRFIAGSATQLCSKTSLHFKHPPVSRTTPGLHFRLLSVTNLLPRATTSEETSSGASQLFGEERDGVITLEEDVPTVQKNAYSESVSAELHKEELPVEEQMQTFEFLDKLNIKLDSEDSYSILLYGTGALVTVWLASGVVGAIDSIPLFPQLLKVVGLAYTFWFSSRYLLFKKNRDELAAKIDELKQQVLGTNDD